MSSSARSLRVTFDSEEEFRREYASNIANGGIFIATNAGFDVRDSVCVELSLDYRDEKLSLDGEIVHVIGAELEGTGATPGVAVQFNLKASELRRQLDPLVGSAVEDERTAQAGRRAARRVHVRIAVRLRTPEGEELDARTRDLSTSGVLLVIQGDPVDVNEKVHVMFTHPSRDQEIELAGTVMRHLRSRSGGPTAMGVRFDIPNSERSAIEPLLGEIQRAEHSRRLGGITGPISEVGIENLLQMFGTCAQQGTLTLMRDEDEGYIVFEQGMLRAARLGDTFGRKALSRLLDWREGIFEFQARADPETFQGEPVSLDAAMLDAIRLFDEGQRLENMELPDDAHLCVDLEKLAASAGELSQVEEAIVELAQVGLTVAKAIDVIPEPDAEIRQRIAGLIDRGLISLGT